MKKQTWIMVAALALWVSGCSGGMWGSKNTLDEQSLAKFGQKKVMEDAREEDDYNSAYEAGEESIFSLGEDSMFSGKSSSKGAEQVRADKLFAGAMEVVMALPIQVANREGGIIATEWKVDPNHTNLRYRVNIHVTGQKPYGKVKVVVLKQQQVSGEWQDRPNDVHTAKNIVKSIRKRAQVARP